MFTSYADTLRYLYDNLPMFQRIGAAAFKKDLTNTITLCAALGDPQKKFRCVHIAGTNGKGSTSHMIASILQSSGYTTGLYTSPHLKEFTERIRVNGREVPQSFVVDFVNRIRPVMEAIRPSFFETTVAMAFDFFAYMKVDIAVVEVGLGGRLDSTNVITPELSVITNIGWDHKDILGDTLEKIAAEKAGIIKSGIPVVISERQESIDKVFEEKATAMNAPLFFASDNYSVVNIRKANTLYVDAFHDGHILLSNFLLPLQGSYQRKNLTGVLKAVEILQNRGWKISSAALREGLERVIPQTGLKGRWQKIGEHPLVICDTGHNVDGVREVMDQIRSQTFKKLHVIWGAVKDKDISEILKLLPREANYIFCQAKIPRAMEANKLAELAFAHGLEGKIVEDVNDALRVAYSEAAADDMIFVGGSTFVVAEIESI